MSESTPSDVRYETTPCPLCGDVRSKPIFVASDLLYGCAGEFTLTQCDACRHTFLTPRPTQDCIGQFYPTDYGPFRGASSVPRPSGSGQYESLPDACGTPHLIRQSSVRSNFNPRSWPWLRRLVLWWIESRAAPIPTNITRPKIALELGCSHGSFLEQLRREGWECVGVEPAAEVAKHAVAKGFDVRIGSLEEACETDSATFSEAQFDAVFAWMVIEHLHDPVATLRMVFQLLKPSGMLLFSVPNFGCWERRVFGRFWYALQLPTHLQHFTPGSLKSLLDGTGFELVELIHQRNVNNLVGSVGLWLRTKLPRLPLGERLIRWTDNPSAWGLCVLAPLAKLLAAIGQAGRLTVVARKIASGRLNLE